MATAADADAAAKAFSDRVCQHFKGGNKALIYPTGDFTFIIKKGRGVLEPGQFLVLVKCNVCKWDYRTIAPLALDTDRLYDWIHTRPVKFGGCPNECCKVKKEEPSEEPCEEEGEDSE